MPANWMKVSWKNFESVLYAEKVDKQLCVFPTYLYLAAVLSDL